MEMFFYSRKYLFVEVCNGSALGRETCRGKVPAAAEAFGNLVYPQIWRLGAQASLYAVGHLLQKQCYLHAVYRAGVIDKPVAVGLLGAGLRKTPSSNTPTHIRPFSYNFSVSRNLQRSLSFPIVSLW